MEPLILTATATTPSVNFDSQTGSLEIHGRSTPENPIAYYTRMIQWVEKYAENPSQETMVRVYFEYFNTSSSKCLLELMKKIKNIQTEGNKVRWIWMYEEGDDDMKEAGSDFSDLLKVPFSLIAKQ